MAADESCSLVVLTGESASIRSLRRPSAWSRTPCDAVEGHFVPAMSPRSASKTMKPPCLWAVSHSGRPDLNRASDKIGPRD
jgi:hypothetical protein